MAWRPVSRPDGKSMDYNAIKSLHVLVVVIFFGGMVANGCVLAASGSAVSVRLARRWNRLLVTPAMLLVWALGITLAVEGGWFVASWLNVKLVLVLALSALHGIQSGTLRRMAADPARKPGIVARLSAPLALLMVAGIVFLAVAKPF
jgi:putative membrane protein